MTAALPTGTVTFLFTDVEGSTRLLQERGDEYAELLVEHRRLLRDAFARHGGVEVDTAGDAFFVAFASARGAVAAAAEAQEALAAGALRARMGLHTGEAEVVDGGYVGYDVHRAARIAAAGHGGQVVLSSSTRALVDGEFRDLGEHRLKDLSAAERLYQLSSRAFPPLKTLSRTNLPVPATPFLGRERELQEVTELFLRGDVRLLTLTGPGGTGKTRLALQAAGALADEYPDGVFWVPLASLGDPELVVPHIAQALDARIELPAHIGGKQLLLLIDNFEHLQAAAAAVAAVAAECPRLALLVTSRAPLHLAGEWEYAVDPLREAEAVALFEQRARAVNRDFSANGEVAEICRRVDCLPLAVELAAARAKLLPPRAILERLEKRLPLLAGGARNAPERQRTLEATIEWSYGLLDEGEQRLFARLAVFAGGCTLDAVADICEADLETLGSLVDQSLVRRTGERFWMLETIREFAAERLEESGEAEELRRRHRDWYLELARQTRPESNRAGARTWLDRLEAEHANVRVAVDGALGSGESVHALRLTSAVWSYWLRRGHWTEGRRSLEAAVALADERDLDSEEGEDALWGASVLAVWQGDAERCLTHATRLLTRSRERNSRRGEAIAINLIGLTAADAGEWDRAKPLFEQTLGLARDLGHEGLITVALNNLGDVEMNLGNYERAIELFEESLAIGEARGDLGRRARQLANIGEANLALGDKVGARAKFEGSVDAARGVGLHELYAWGLLGLATTWLDDEPARAARLLGASDAIAEQLGTSLQPFERRLHEHTLAEVISSPAEEAYRVSLAHSRTLSREDAAAWAIGSDAE